MKKGEEVIFEKSYIEAFCSGRHDRVFDMIKTFQSYPDKVFPETRFTGIYDIAAQQSWLQIAEVAKLRNLTPVGGMVVALTSDPATREAAIKITVESLENEHAKGSVQAWEAMPDTTDIAMKILSKTKRVALTTINDMNVEKPVSLLPIYSIPYGKKRDLELKEVQEKIQINLLRSPKGEVSSSAVYENINKAIEYIEAWFRGFGVIPFRQKDHPTKPVIMQNMATTERARSELWTWLKHKVVLNDLNQPFTEAFFLDTCKKVLDDIRKSIEEGFLPKGKMSCDQFEKGCYEKASEILKQVVLSESFPDNLKTILLQKYYEIHGIL